MEAPSRVDWPQAYRPLYRVMLFLQTGMESNLKHLRHPLPVMVSFAWWLPVGLLPDMHHFMHKGRKDHLITSPDKTIRIKRQLMHFSFTNTASKPFR